MWGPPFIPQLAITISATSVIVGKGSSTPLERSKKKDFPVLLVEELLVWVVFLTKVRMFICCRT